ERQFRAYRDLVLGMTGRTVTIRTLDLGADKADRSGLVLDNEPNPAMGVRGVRLSLRRPGLFETQLRAIARASGYGPVRLLLPMVSGREEVLEARARLERVRRELRDAGQPVADEIPVGAMIEVPAAALALPGFIGELDFLSVGTNDLVQYLLAADRNNDALGERARQAGGGVGRDRGRRRLRAAVAGAWHGGTEHASGHPARGPARRPRLRPGPAARTPAGPAARTRPRRHRGMDAQGAAQ